MHTPGLDDMQPMIFHVLFYSAVHSFGKAGVGAAQDCSFSRFAQRDCFKFPDAADQVGLLAIFAAASRCRMASRPEALSR